MARDPTSRRRVLHYDPRLAVLEYETPRGEWRTVSLGGGGGVTAHTSLTALTWGASGHTGTADRIAGFSSLGAASVYTLPQVLDLAAGTPADGDLLVRSGGTWVRLAAGATSGHVLTSTGAGSAPSWQAALGAHATTHKNGGSDELLLHELGEPTASVEFAQQEALQFRIENLTTDPGSPAEGQIWLRTDL